MSKRLFENNPYIKEFTANINKIIEQDNEFHVILNQTAFYPEGGGQPSDKGFIDDVEVSYVYENDDNIFHVISTLPSKLERVHCAVDWKRRFDYMQQHLGQHILSASFYKLYDISTVGFHLSSDYTTIDIDSELKEEDIENVEFFANQIVFNDLLVDIIYPESNEIYDFPLRKQPKVSENIRIVKIDDYDYSPCCGTHPNRTGEVGLIKIKKADKYKGGMRIEFLCGNRALRDYHWKNESINSISSILSVKDKDTLEGVYRINEELIRSKKEIKELKEKLINYESQELHNNSITYNEIKIIKKIFKDRDFNDLRLLSSILTEKEGTITLFGVKNDNKAQLLFSRSKGIKSININNILKKAIGLIDGKGGGNPETAQGGGKITENLLPALEMALKDITKQLRK